MYWAERPCFGACRLPRRSEMAMYNEAIADATQAIAIDPAWYHYFSRAKTKIEMGIERVVSLILKWCLTLLFPKFGALWIDAIVPNDWSIFLAQTWFMAVALFWRLIGFCGSIVHCSVHASAWSRYVACNGLSNSLLCSAWPLRFEVSSDQAMGKHLSKLVKRGALICLGDVE